MLQEFELLDNFYLLFQAYWHLPWPESNPERRSQNRMVILFVQTFRIDKNALQIPGNNSYLFTSFYIEPYYGHENENFSCLTLLKLKSFPYLVFSFHYLGKYGISPKIEVNYGIQIFE